MLNWDVVIIGGGPAGLTAGLYLSQARCQTILLDKESFGGKIKNCEKIENYPGFHDGVSGAHLASEMIDQSTKYGLQLEQAEVVGIELFSSRKWVKCACAETGHVAKVVIIAGGSQPKRLDVHGEEAFQGKGVFNCAFCDGGQFLDSVVAVCGGGDAGVSSALYLAKLASKVIILEAESFLSATAILQEEASANPKLEIHCGVTVEAIAGDSHVKEIELLERASGRKKGLKVDGVLVHIGVVPNTSYLEGIVSLDSQGQIIVNSQMETDTRYILACGDIRSGSPGQIATAVGDGTTAAITALKLLREVE